MPITVLQIIPNLGAGGAEQACVDIVAGLKARGDRALVMSAGGNRVAEIERLGGEHFLWPVASKNPCRIINNARKLARFISDMKVDVVHVRSRAPAWSAWPACRKTGCKFVTTFHAAYKFSNPVKRFYNGVMAKSDRIIAISEFIAEHIRRTYGAGNEKITVIPRGIDITRFSPEAVTEERREALRSAWSIADKAPVILLPARVSPIKGHTLFIEAMARLPKEIAARAVIVGDEQGRDEYLRNLKSLINALNLQDRVRIAGHCADMPAAYSLADLVVAPSSVPEGFGRAPVEAMAMGKPIIASDLGAFRETIEDGKTGWLLPPESPDAWAEAIGKAIAMTHELRAEMSVAARKAVLSKYDSRWMVRDTLGVYDLCR